MSILFFSTDPRPIPVSEGIVAHCRPLSTPQLLTAENLWEGGGFGKMLEAAKYAIPLSLVKIDGLKDERGRDVPSPEEFGPEWVERLSPEAVSAFLRAALSAGSPDEDSKNA